MNFYDCVCKSTLTMFHSKYDFLTLLAIGFDSKYERLNCIILNGKSTYRRNKPPKPILTFNGLLKGDGRVIEDLI